MPGLNLLMYIERVPNDSTSRVTAVSNPAMIEAISITVTTPMITPMTVRNERSLLPRRVARAIQRFSRISLRNSFIGTSSICAQGFDWIQPRRFPGREQAGHHAGGRRHANRAGNGSHRKISLHKNLGHDF